MAAANQGGVRVFISYSTKDADLVQRLKDGLARAGVDVWLDHERLTVGTPNWQRAILDGIAQATHVIYVASESAAESPDICIEIDLARDEGKSVIIFWARGTKWRDCVPLGWWTTQFIDGRGVRFYTGLAKLLLALSPAASNAAPVQPATVFISYSRKDTPFVERLKQDLRQAGAHIWIDHESLPLGHPDWQAAIRQGIESASIFVYVGSPDAALSSNVGAEVQIAKEDKRAGVSLNICPMWARGEQWSNCAPFELIRANYVDARGERYPAARDAILERLQS